MAILKAEEAGFAVSPKIIGLHYFLQTARWQPGGLLFSALDDQGDDADDDQRILKQFRISNHPITPFPKEWGQKVLAPRKKGANRLKASRTHLLYSKKIISHSDKRRKGLPKPPPTSP